MGHDKSDLYRNTHAHIVSNGYVKVFIFIHSITL